MDRASITQGTLPYPFARSANGWGARLLLRDAETFESHGKGWGV